MNKKISNSNIKYLNKLNLKGVDGEHSQSKDGVYDISNKVRLGKSEFELIHVMW